MPGGVNNSGYQKGGKDSPVHSIAGVCCSTLVSRRRDDGVLSQYTSGRLRNLVCWCCCIAHLARRRVVSPDGSTMREFVESSYFGGTDP